MKANAFLRAAGCSLISFALVFYVIPVFFAGGTEKVLWMSLMVVFPALIAVVMLDRIRPLWVFLNLPIHYGLLYLLAAPMAQVWSTTLDSTVSVWPLLVTTVQFFVLRFQKKRK